MKEEIIVNGIVFNNITVYSQSDKVRDKGTYKCSIFGLIIFLSNSDQFKSGIHFSCAGLGISDKYFTNKEISWEAAAGASVKYIKEHLEKILSKINSLA